LSAPIFDYITLVLPSGAIHKADCGDYWQLLHWIFGTSGRIAMGGIQSRRWMVAYADSATLIDETGEVAGKVGFAENGSVCISLTGQGCRHVADWRHVYKRLQMLKARLTRLDIAVDDLQGQNFDVQSFLRAYQEGEFTMNGRPPTARFVDDLGNDKGCTLYIGQKGHKELCIYEKGKQLGDMQSRYVRCELRLYAKRLELPLEALIRPGEFFAGAYPMLADFVFGEATRLLVRERQTAISAAAAVKFLRTQGGTYFNLCLDALGHLTAEAIIEHVRQKIARPGRPGRFKGYVGDLSASMRDALLGESHETESQF
jgi:DNA relaxase NicK